MPSRFTRDHTRITRVSTPPPPPLTSNRDMDNEAQKSFLKIAQVIDLIIYYLFISLFSNNSIFNF